MNLLDAFFYTFEADTSKLEDGVDRAEGKAKKLGDEIKKTDDRASKLGASFRTALIGLAGAAASLFAVGALRSTIAEAMDYGAALADTSDRLNIAVEDLDAWQGAVARAGGSATDFETTLENLNKAVGEYARAQTGPLADVSKVLGLSLKDANGHMRTAADLLPDIANGLQSLSTAARADVAAKLGIDRATLAMLQEGRASVEDLIKKQKELGVVSAADAEASRKMRMQLMDTRRVFNSISRDVMMGFMPALTSLLRRFESIGVWVRDNKDLIKGFFIGLGTFITAVYLPAVARAAIATLAWLAPFLLIGAAIAAVAALFALAYEDFVIWQEGGESLIGKLLAKFPGLETAIRGILDALGVVGSYFEALGRLIVGILTGNVSKAWADFGKRIGEIIERIREISPEISAAFDTAARVASSAADIVKAAWKTVIDFFRESLALVGSVIDTVGAGARKVGEWLGMSNDQDEPDAPYGPEVPTAPKTNYGPEVPVIPARDLSAAQAQLSLAANSPVSAMTPQAVAMQSRGPANRTNEVHIKEVNVVTQATDAKGISEAVGQSLTEEMRSAIDEYDDGVDR